MVWASQSDQPVFQNLAIYTERYCMGNRYCNYYITVTVWYYIRSWWNPYHLAWRTHKSWMHWACPEHPWTGSRRAFPWSHLGDSPQKEHRIPPFGDPLCRTEFCLHRAQSAAPDGPPAPYTGRRACPPRAAAGWETVSEEEASAAQWWGWGWTPRLDLCVCANIHSHLSKHLCTLTQAHDVKLLVKGGMEFF